MTDQQVSTQPGFLEEGTGQTIGLALDRHVLRVSGEIDAATAGEFELALAAAFEPTEPLQVDLSGVPFMDSSGLRALLAVSRVREITVSLASPAVRHVLELSGLAGYFHLD